MISASKTFQRGARLGLTTLSLFALSACGVQGSAGSRFSFPQSSNGQANGNFPINEQVFEPSAPQTASYSNELKRCDKLRDLADSITGPCGPAMTEYVNEISRNCYSWFQQMYNYECGGLESRLRNALNACSQDLSASFNFLPASCQSSLKRFFK